VKYFPYLTLNLSDRSASIFAIMLLCIMAITATLSMKNDALTFDELAHIPAGYSYLTKQDYRVNPEHPPLIKDISAIPLLFLNLNFPEEKQVWLQEDAAPAWWVQFDLGREFLYHSGNSPGKIIFWARLAIIGLSTALGGLIFWWTKKTLGNVVALGVLALFAFSPTFIAHGRLANTDIGAVFGAFLATIFWLKFLDNPSWKNILFAGIAFGIAMLLKFSLVLLIPFFIIITPLYALLFSKKILAYLGKALIAGIAGFVLIIWPVYQFHILNYPAKQQIRDTVADISGHPTPLAKNLTIWMAEQELLRAPAQYFRGLLMVSQRTAWGNTTYYLGKISAGSQWHYFPLLYLLKIPFAFHVLTLFALAMLLAAYKGTYKGKNKKNRAVNWSRKNFWVIAFLVWIAVYLLTAITGNLNIGIRHILPVFPFIYVLVIFAVYRGLKSISLPKIRQAVITLILFLFFWYATSSLLAFPHYVPYYNKLGGGLDKGYKIAVDSNYDWGQDFYRLLSFIEKNNIQKISIDYFGGESPEYWLGKKYQKLEPKKVAAEEKNIQGWVAVSLNQLMGGVAKPAEGFDQETGYYHWLEEYKPVGRAGYSIFIYHID